MKETPILFTPANHRLIISEEKVQTRRVITEEWNHLFKPSEHYPYTKKPFERAKDAEDDFVTFSEPYTRTVGEPVWFYSWGNSRWLRSPYGKPGDKLYVKEGVITHASIPQLVGYYMDGCRVTEHWEKRLTAMFMPKWAARTWLEIIDVRVEKLQDISHDDAIAEGCKGYGWVSESPYFKGPHTDDGQLPQEEYRQLWDSINGKKHPWSSNPWTWAITFRKI